MSKRRRTADKFYQEWHVKREQAVVNTAIEFKLDIPRPLTGLPPGRYYAIELHSIEYYVKFAYRNEAATCIHVSLSTSPRTGQLPFITNCGDPSNLWCFIEAFWGSTEHASSIESVYTRDRNCARFTDDLGHGRLLIGDHLYLQIDSVNFSSELIEVQFAFEYTETSVNCAEYAQDLTAQLLVG